MKITDITNKNMFWGVTIEGGKRYAQTVQTSFHISMAALEPQHDTTTHSGKQSNLDGKHASVMINHDKAEFLLCTLTHGKLYQQPLDLNFTEGEEVTFYLNGPGIVHLTGFLTPEEPLEDETKFSDNETDSSYVEEEEESSEEGSEEESDEEDSDEEVPKLKPIKFNMDSSTESSPEKSATKRKKQQKKDTKGKKKKKLEEEEESDEEEESEEEDSDEMEVEESEEEDAEEDDDDSEWETEESNFLDDEAEEAESDEEEEDDSEEDEHTVASGGSFLEPRKSKVKQEMEKLKKVLKDKKNESQKKEKKSPKSKAANVEVEKVDEDESVVKLPSTNGTTEGIKKKKKKKKNKKKDVEDGTNASNQANITNNSSSSPTKGAKPKKRTIKGGINVEDTEEGHGPEALHGKTVSVYYTGKLNNGKQFDSCTSGKPFKFKLGKGDVIKGWEAGVVGMKVGGKRKLVIPPSQGYGDQKTGPIPPKSTLHFEIELKAVS